MAINTVYHAIGDNRLKINNQTYTWVNGNKVIVGVENPDETEIVQDENGYNYSRNSVEAQEVYNKSTQSHSTYFILDLETGYNPKRFFPGAEIHGTIENNDVNVYEEASTESTVVGTVSHCHVVITNLDNINQEKDFYKIEYGTIIGYVEKSYMSDIIYEAKFN